MKQTASSGSLGGSCNRNIICDIFDCDGKDIQQIQKDIPLKVFGNPEFVLPEKRGSLPKLDWSRDVTGRVNIF